MIVESQLKAGLLADAIEAIQTAPKIPRRPKMMVIAGGC